MEPTHARVLIAGGSVAGLTLANMLERAGIDYLVLEKYSKIAPDLGASIAIFPNAARLLDQIGCWNVVEGIYDFQDMFKEMTVCDTNGKQIASVANAAQQFRQLHGYQAIFIDRQQLVQILYDNLKDKSRVLVDHGIEKVQQHVGTVRVVATNGRIFSGELLVGADGIHSVVRKEMWRIAGQEDPGRFSMAELDNVRIGWRVVYGISKQVSSYPAHTTGHTQGNGRSYLTSVGPGGKIYWFLFEKLEREIHGLYEKIPRYTEEDLQKLATKYGDDQLVGDLRLRDLWDSRVSATLQALPEMTLDKWHFGRMVLIGDAAHKYNPIGGQGGAQAIEDAAALTNQLHRLLDSKRNADPSFDAEITSMLETFQMLRHDRAKSFEKSSHQLQNVQARSTIVGKFIADWVLPLTNNGKISSRLSAGWVQAIKLDFVDVPKRAHSMPFADERPTPAPQRSSFIILCAIASVALGWGTLRLFPSLVL